MQERRYRPGDVLDDYCPRERRITDHAIVAMIDNEIRRTRCGVCDAEHEYKEAKVPAPRRKTQPPALFTQVLDGLQGPTAPHAPAAPDTQDEPDTIEAESVEVMAGASAPRPEATPAPMAAAAPTQPAPEQPSGQEPTEEDREEGPIRRSLIRAQFPKIEGQVPTPRANPEFTIQALNNRNNRQGRPGKNRRRRGGGGGGGMDHIGPMRTFGRDNGHGGGGGRGFGHGGQGGGQGQGQGHGPGGGGGRRRRRGGKKNG